MSLPALETIEVEAKKSANCVIVWLPGLEQSGHHMKHIADDLRVPDFIQVKHIFVHPPKGSFLPQNKVIRRWIDFEINEGKFSFKKDVVDFGISEVQNIINTEIDKGVSPENIYVAGFSQGSVIGYFASTTLKRKIGGLIILSGISPSMFGLRDSQKQQTEIPVLLCHGTKDKIFSLDQGKSSAADLKKKGFQVDFKEYDMGHEICEQEVKDIAQWIENHYKQKNALAS